MTYKYLSRFLSTVLSQFTGFYDEVYYEVSMERDDIIFSLKNGHINFHFQLESFIEDYDTIDEAIAAAKKEAELISSLAKDYGFKFLYKLKQDKETVTLLCTCSKTIFELTKLNEEELDDLEITLRAIYRLQEQDKGE